MKRLNDKMKDNFFLGGLNILYQTNIICHPASIMLEQPATQQQLQYCRLQDDNDSGNKIFKNCIIISPNFCQLLLMVNNIFLSECPLYYYHDYYDYHFKIRLQAKSCSFLMIIVMMNWLISSSFSFYFPKKRSAIPLLPARQKNDGTILTNHRFVKIRAPK